MRVATYTRISTGEDHQPYSLEAQAHRLDAYVASQEGWSLTRSAADARDTTAALEAASTSPPTADQLADTRVEIRAAIENGTTPTKHALLQALVQGITVEGRHAIQPVFRVPEPNESHDGDARFASCRDCLVGLVGWWRPRQDSNLRPAD